jgi:energy-coupling factor transporter ATP-binding protein EcfA2
VSLKLNTEQKAGVVDVLSEGERRSVALAFFLAEVAASKHRGGIIIDDPVSSLDHSRRSYVARRLVAESAIRQTIVFTHDIVFLLELEDQITKVSGSCERRVIFRSAGSSGVLAKAAPWIIQNVKSRIGTLRNDLQKLQALERADDPEAFRLATKAWFELLRETWERVVEEKVFNGVVSRFSPGIQTQRLAKVLVTAGMAKAVEEAMTQASAWTHDQGAALGKPTATGADLKQALDDLETFCGQFKT